MTFTYRFHERSARSYLRPMIRASGASGSSQMPNGYRLEFRSDSATVKLQSVVNGTSTQLASFTYTMDTNPQKVRFRVIGSTIRAKVWPVGTSEPVGWSLEATDTSVTAPGVFQINHNYSSGAHTVTVDDTTVDDEDTLFTGQQVWGFPACSASNQGQTISDDAKIRWTCDGTQWMRIGGMPSSWLVPSPCDPNGSDDGATTLWWGITWECKYISDLGRWDWEPIAGSIL